MSQLTASILRWAARSTALLVTGAFLLLLSGEIFPHIHVHLLHLENGQASDYFSPQWLEWYWRGGMNLQDHYLPLRHLLCSYL